MGWEIFFNKLTNNPNLKKSFFLGGEGAAKYTYMNKCFKCHFYSSGRTNVPNDSEIHA